MLYEYSGVSEFTGAIYHLTIDLTRDSHIGEAGSTLLKEGKYMLPEETSPQEAFARAACAYASDQEHAQRLYDYASKLWFMFSTPVLSNAANPRGLPISCNLNQADDSREGLAENWKEDLFLSTMGAGISTDMSLIRSVGTGTSRGTSTPGLMPFIKVIDSITCASKQGEVRRGAVAVYLDISHPEIDEFLVMREASGGGDLNRKCLNIHHAVNITDDFMRKVIAGESWDLVDPHTKKVTKTVQARDLWTTILQMRMKTGEPYIHFVDASNRGMPQELKDRGLKINQSNLCVAPETLVLTKNGHQEIQSLVNSAEFIWNGQEWSNVFIKKTSDMTELVRVHFSDGSSLDCTPEHKFYIQEAYGAPPKEYRAKDLEIGMKLEKMCLPTTIHSALEDFPNAYSHGFYCGDGNESYEFSWVYSPKAEVVPFLCGKVSEEFDNYGRKRWDHGVFEMPKFSVPNVQNSSIKGILDWFSGYLDADGCVIESDNCQNIQTTSVNWKFLHDIKLTLQTLGVDCTLCKRRDAGDYPLPKNDGSGENKNYDCNEIWLLGVGGEGVKRLLELGLNTKRLKFGIQNPQRSASKFITVSNVEWTGRMSPTFCFTEHLRGKGVFNGVLTGQCSEITLPTSPDRTAVCCLSSVNLEYFDEWSKEDKFVADLIEMLDNVLSVFIEKAPRELWRAVASASRERSIGLGAMGFHSFLQKKGIPFESATASSANRSMFKHIKQKAEAHSLLLGRTRGEAPDMEGSGKRFSFMLAIAPNASSSIICGFTSPSIEPYNSNFFVQKTRRGAFVLLNKHLDKLLTEKYFLSGAELTKAWDDILNAEGSVRTLDFMSEEDKEVFKTAFELDQAWVVDHASTRQEYICQAQSVNLFFPKDTEFDYLHKIHKAAWEKNLKTLYYVRSKAAGRVKNTSLQNQKTGVESACLSCEG